MEKEYIKYNKIVKPNFKLLYYLNYYDGPITGMVEININNIKNIYWFSKCDEQINYNEDEFTDNDEIELYPYLNPEDVDETDNSPEWYRRYTIHELTIEDINEEIKDHDIFRFYVGLHTDYDDNGNRLTYHMNSNHNYKEYLNQCKNNKLKNYKNNNIIGWFEL